MPSSASRPPDSSHTSHRFTRWRVTSKFGFARLTPARSSMNTREALYRGPPIASQYSWKDTRYAVGLRCPAAHRTPVTDATRPGRRSRPRMSIRGSVRIGRIGIVTTPFPAAFGSGSHSSFYSRSNWARAAAVSKKIVRPSWPHALHTYDRLSLSIPAIGPITRSFGWTWLLPHRAHAAKSVGPKRPAIRSASFDANHFHALANPIRRKVDAAGTPALRHDLLDHLLTEHLELRFLPGARHAGPPASYSGRTDKACEERLCCSYPRQKESSIRQRHMPAASMPSRPKRKREPDQSFDLYARAMLDYWLGKKVVFEVERDDGYRSRSRVESYFAAPAKWLKVEREAMKEGGGRVLGVGGGPGRHGRYLRRKRHAGLGVA